MFTSQIKAGGGIFVDVVFVCMCVCGVYFCVNVFVIVGVIGIFTGILWR